MKDINHFVHILDVFCGTAVFHQDMYPENAYFFLQPFGNYHRCVYVPQRILTPGADVQDDVCFLGTDFITIFPHKFFDISVCNVIDNLA